MHFQTAVAPDWIVLQIYSDTTSYGQPSSEPLMTFECSRFAQPPCDFREQDGAIALDIALSKTLPQKVFMTLFASWYVPEMQRRSGEVNDPLNVSATWLFRFDQVS